MVRHAAAGRRNEQGQEVSSFHSIPLFRSDTAVSDEQRAQMDSDGHLVLPGLLTDDAVDRLIASLSRIHTLRELEASREDLKAPRAEIEAIHRKYRELTDSQGLSVEEANARREEEVAVIRDQHPDLKKHGVGAVAMEYDDFLESCVGHPQMLGLAREVLGSDIRFDHMVALNRPGATPPMGYHTHEYADGNQTFDDEAKFPRIGRLAAESRTFPNDPSLGFIRIFFYVTGFEQDNGNLKVVPGSHLFRDSTVNASDDDALERGWMKGKLHPLTGEPLCIQPLECPRGSVVLMWTHALHGVNGRAALAPTRWCVVTAYRNPGAPSHARWIDEEWEMKDVPGLIETSLGPRGLKDHTWT